MIRIKKIVPKGIFVFQGKASANSSFIEDLREAKKFIILANHYLKGYLKIHEYLLTQDGWIMIVRIKSKKAILRTHHLSGVDIDRNEIWRIISERMRILLSTFVKFTNKKQGRTGSKVHSSYERYLFEDLEEALDYIQRIRAGLIRLGQTKRKYRSIKSHYLISEKLGRGSIFISSRKLKKRVKRLKIRLNSIKIQAFQTDVLHDLIESTKSDSLSLNTRTILNSS